MFEDRGGSFYLGFENFKNKVVKNLEKWLVRLLNIFILENKGMFLKYEFFFGISILK